MTLQKLQECKHMVNNMDGLIPWTPLHLDQNGIV